MSAWPQRGAAGALRVALATPGPDAAEAIAPWFAAAWRDIYGGGRNAPPTPAQWLGAGAEGARPLLIALRGRAIGIIRCLAGDRELTISELAMAPVQRNLGYGAEAIYALEAQYGTLTRARALVPRANGLAIYFWLRVGYRPLFAADSHVTAMVRDLAASADRDDAQRAVQPAATQPGAQGRPRTPAPQAPR